MVALPIKPPNRDQLIKVANGDFQVARAIEDLFTQAGNLTPEDIAAINAKIVVVKADIVVINNQVVVINGQIVVIQADVVTAKANIIALQTAVFTPSIANSVKVNPTNSAAIDIDFPLAANRILGRGAGNIVAIDLGAGLAITGSTMDVTGDPVVTFAGLAALATKRAFVTDSLNVAAGNFGAAVAAGGANYVPVYKDGAVWRIG